MYRNRRIVWTSLLILVLLLVTPNAALAGKGGPNNKQLYKTFTVVSTNDFHGALEGATHSWSHGDVVGGAAWLAGYFNIIRSEDPGGFLYLDAGDMMQGTLVSNYFNGASTIEALNEMKLAATAIGNHEFDWGQEILAEREQQAHFPFLAANVYYKDTMERPDWATPYIIKRVKGIKVGIVGVSAPETPTITNPSNVADLDFTDPDDAVNDLIDDMEAKGATVIIAIAHIGGFYPNFEEGIKDFACSLDSDEVDLIVSGHTHSRIDDVLCGIPVIQAYSSGTAFARVDFTVNKRTREVVDYEMNSYPTSTYNTYYGDPVIYDEVELMPDPEVQEIVDHYSMLIEDVKNEVIGETTVPITRNYRYESSMGDWVTDIMRYYAPGINFAFTNSGGLRTDIDAGIITYGEIFEAQPFDNTLVVVELDGSEVRQVLEEGITGAHGVIQVSGLEFSFDYDQPAGSRIVGDVIDASTGLPLDPTATYFVAVNDFMANGGDEYDTLADNPQVNSYVLVRDMIVDWVGNNSPFTPPDPAVEKRITIFGTAPN